MFGIQCTVGVFLLQIDLEQIVAVLVLHKLKDRIEARTVQRNSCKDLRFGESILVSGKYRS